MATTKNLAYANEILLWLILIAFHKPKYLFHAKQQSVNEGSQSYLHTNEIKMPPNSEQGLHVTNLLTVNNSNE